MGIGAYYKKVVLVAFRPSWSIAQTIMATGAACCCFAWEFIPAVQRNFGQRPDIPNMWQAIALTFGAVFIIRLLCAPFWIYEAQVAALNERMSAEKLFNAAQAAEQIRHKERMHSEKLTRLIMQEKGTLAKVAAKFPPKTD